MTIYLFPGQGSQALGMGKILFDEFPKLVQKIDAILGYSIVKLCLENPNDQLNQTQFTQPAVYVVNALSYLKKKHNSEKPTHLAGHSLGEYNALFAAEVFDFETGLKLVLKRGELMSKTNQGAMAAVVGLKSEEVQSILVQEYLHDVTIANFNSFSQVVISGPKSDIINAQSLFEQAGATLYIPLKVSGAFHSPYMSQAQEAFTGFLNQYTFQAPKIPVIANVNAKPYQMEEVTTLLAQQITSPVRWTDTIQYLLSLGKTDFTEIGMGDTLIGLVRRIQNGK